MAQAETSSGDVPENGEVEFFGVKLSVRSPHLAALLNSSVTEDVQVIGRRARDAFGAGESHSVREDHERALDADDSVSIRLDEL